MGKPYVPYTAKRIIEACLEHNWDFELVHAPVTLFLNVSDGTNTIQAQFRKTPGVDSMQRPTVKYETISIHLDSTNDWRSVGMSIDTACMFIETHTIQPSGNPVQT